MTTKLEAQPRKVYRFKPKPTSEDRNIDLRELCTIRGRSRSSTLRDVEIGLIPKPFKIRGKNYWSLSSALEANERARNSQGV